MAKAKKPSAHEQKIAELTADLQRLRADFENYRKRVEADKDHARTQGQTAAIIKLLPTVDTIERAARHIPKDLADNAWVKGIAGLSRQLETSLASLNVQRIDATPGAAFNPELHEAIQFDEDSDGDHEVIAEELQAGYTLNGTPIRHAMVKVARR